MGIWQGPTRRPRRAGARPLGRSARARALGLVSAISILRSFSMDDAPPGRAAGPGAWKKTLSSWQLLSPNAQ